MQVVTGFEDGPSEAARCLSNFCGREGSSTRKASSAEEQNALRRHAASKARVIASLQEELLCACEAYQNLSSQRAAHDTLLRLGACPGSQRVSSITWRLCFASDATTQPGTSWESSVICCHKV